MAEHNLIKGVAKVVAKETLSSRDTNKEDQRPRPYHDNHKAQTINIARIIIHDLYHELVVSK